MEKKLKKVYYYLVFAMIAIVFCSKVPFFYKEMWFAWQGNRIYYALVILFYLTITVVLSVYLFKVDKWLTQKNGGRIIIISAVIFIAMLVPHIVGLSTGEFMLDYYAKYSGSLGSIKHSPKYLYYNLPYLALSALSAAALIISIIYYVKFCPHKSKNARIAELEREVEELKKKD